MSVADRERRVSAAFVTLADTLVDDYDVIDLLDQLTEHCVSLLAADAAGVLLSNGRGELQPVAASNEDAQTMELLQVQADEGPCVDAFRTIDQVRVPDLSTASHRWPTFVAAVTRVGIYASVHAIPLRRRGQAIGALNLFHHAPGALPDADLALAQALADAATIGILQERAIRGTEVVNEQLQAALNSRVVIEQAKGVLAQRWGVGMDVAFDRLRRHARSTHQHLTDLAHDVVNGRVDLAVLPGPASSTSESSRS